ncbi:MAG: DUF3515 domain-containing protein [Gordonia sp. (in: high G+C Gram-positive bacteria)]
MTDSTPTPDDQAEPSGTETDRTTAEVQKPQRELSPALIATLVAIPVMVIAGFITFAVLKNKADPSTPVDSYATVSADADKCPGLIDALPATMGDYDKKKVDGNTVRWTGSPGGAIVLRCGVARPSGFAPSSSLQVVDPIQWYMTDSEEGRGQVYVAVDHRPYVALWVPVGAGNTALTEVSTLIAQKLTAAPLDFGK